MGACADGVPEAEGILEIGPGRGALTEGLLGLGLPYFAIEKDFALCAELSERYPKGNIALGDALELDIPHISGETGIGSWLVVGNLPYNSATKILLRLMRWPDSCTALLVMLQREVAEKFSAGAGERGCCSMSAWRSAWWEAERLFDLPPGAFSPVPKVTSTFCSFSPRTVPLLPIKDQGGYWKFLEAAFSHPRKVLAKNLVAAGGADWAGELEKLGISRVARPSDVSPESYRALYLAGGMGQG